MIRKILTHSQSQAASLKQFHTVTSMSSTHKDKLKQYKLKVIVSSYI